MEGLLVDKLNDSGMLYFYLVSLISADTLISPDDCDRSIFRINELLKEIPESNLSEEDKEKIINFCNESLEICERDKKTLVNLN